MNWHSQRSYIGSGPNSTDSELAIVHLDEMIECDVSPAQQASFLNQRATYLKQRRRWTEAAADLTRMIELKPKWASPTYWLDRAECYCQLNESLKARADMEEFLKSNRTAALQLFRQRLATQENSRNWTAVILYSELVLGSKPHAREQATLLYRRARARLELRQFSEALADCERAFVLQPDSAETQQLLVRLTEAQVADLQLQGKTDSAIERRQQTRAVLEKRLAAQPDNEAAALALAEQLFAEASSWIVLDPLQFRSAGGATLTRLPDGSILASGPNPQNDAYALQTHTPLGSIRAIRLEALPDASLPKNGPGLADNGNFVISEFRIRAGDRPLNPTQIVATAESRGPNSVSPAKHAVDGHNGTIWGILQQPNQPVAIGLAQAAIATLDEPATVNDDLIFSLQFGYSNALDRNLGRFRLSVSSSDRAMLAEQIRMSSVNAWLKLAAARLLHEDRPSAEAALQQALRNPAGLTSLPNRLLLAWLHGRLGRGEATRGAQQAVVKLMRTHNGDQPLPLPSLAVEVFQRTDSADAMSLSMWRARTFDQLGDSKAASAEYLKAFTAEAAPMGLLSERALFFRRNQDWKHAATDYQVRFERSPDNAHLGLETAPLLVLGGNQDSYRRHCESMLARFENAPAPFTLEQVAKACALQPLSVDQARRLVALSERALKSPERSGYASFYETTHALTLYRAGEYKAAIEQGKTAVRVERINRAPSMAALARLIQAMAHHKLAQPDDAMRLLKEAETIANRDLPDLDHTLPAAGWHDVLICHLILDEARRTITPNASPRAPAPREAVRLDSLR